MAKTQKFTFKKLLNKTLRQFNYDEYKKDKNQKYVKNGEDNMFPQHLIEMYNKSSVNAACINAIVEGIIGQGLTANQEIYLQKANSAGDSWNDLFAKCALDFKLHGSFSMEIVYSNDRTRLEAYHIDFSTLRAKEKNKYGHIPGYFISDKWDKKNRFSGVVYKNEDDIDFLPVYNPDKKEEEPHQI